MILPFLNRDRERERLARALASPNGTFCCLYGRRRCGKSRLIREVIPKDRSVYYVADRREAGLQRSALAAAIGLVIPRFEDATYPDWDALLNRWWSDAPPGSVLALDEFPYLASASPELPSLLQKAIDRYAAKPVHLIVSGSSQRMMQGLVLDEAEPLYGRAREIMLIEPLAAAWLPQAFGPADWTDLLSTYAVWGGVPRYWELAADYASLWDAVESLVLDPLGVLHREPAHLLADDMRDIVQASSILAVVGQGCHRLSEIAGRLAKPATSLTRPVQRLIQLGLLRRDIPFGHSPRSSKTTLYMINDPYIAFWFTFVEPNRSRLGAGAIPAVKRSIRKTFPQHVAAIWEQTVRSAVPRVTLAGLEWKAASRWWGSGKDRRPMEFDVVAESTDGRHLLVGEVKLSVTTRQLGPVTKALSEKIGRLPVADHYASVVPCVFAGGYEGTPETESHLITAQTLLPSLT